MFNNLRLLFKDFVHTLSDLIDDEFAIAIAYGLVFQPKIKQHSSDLYRIEDACILQFQHTYSLCGNGTAPKIGNQFKNIIDHKIIL